jgi:hypothetical protein
LENGEAGEKIFLSLFYGLLGTFCHSPEVLMALSIDLKTLFNLD